MLGGEPLEQRVGVRRVADLERAERRVLAAAVEDDDAARAALGDEAREPVDELARVREAGRRGAGCSRRRGRGWQPR